ncbi:MAG TPA: sulfatase-like hydrolase/transferase [Geminicoccaceae bacterium]|nr:sulfatase-like hydrolase/transferase [Geminicoccaceae bacterium]
MTAIFCGTIIGAFASSAAASTPQNQPNIVLIVADDLGYGHLGSYGQEKIATLHLDRLAAEGLRFTHAYAGGPVCAPSRAALLTGLHTGHAPIRGNRGMRLPPETITIADVMKQAGYATGVIGKWGFALPELDWSFPTRYGSTSSSASPTICLHTSTGRRRSGATSRRFRPEATATTCSRPKRSTSSHATRGTRFFSTWPIPSRTRP